MTQLTRDAVLKHFDRLQEQGELFYSPSTPQRIVDHGLEFSIRIVPAFTSKPQLTSQNTIAQSSSRPKPTDGSDIDHADPAFFVACVNPFSSNITQSSAVTTSNAASQANADAPAINTNIDTGTKYTHKLILNKFNVHRPQYILLTTDPLQRQTAPLNLDDFNAAWTVLNALTPQREKYVIFNCGAAGGSSRRHKHLQVFEDAQPLDENERNEGVRERGVLWPDLDIAGASNADNVDTARVRELKLPYLAFASTLPRACTPSQLLQSYNTALSQCRGALQHSPDEMSRSTGETAQAEAPPHNLILTRRALVVIPRSKGTTEGIEGHVVNAPGMMGVVWCSNGKQLQAWKRKGPVSVLRELGVPRDVLGR
ncbi:MAG: hypothetical protein Q9159_007436 [Coniocarpon cinnabarinum]